MDASDHVIGLIADTHSLLRPEAVAALEGCGLIIHAGDVGSPEILRQLSRIAPVLTVKGNIDQGPWAAALPDTAAITANAISLYVLHNLQHLALDPAAAGIQIVVSGHSHKAARVEKNGVLYLNPGSAGPRRFRLPITVARLSQSPSGFTIEFVDLLA